MSQTKSVNEMDVFEKMGYAFSRIDESWEALKFNITTFLGIIAVPILATLIAIPILLIPFFTNVNNNNGVISGFAAFTIFTFSILLVIIWLLVSPALIATQLASVRKQKISISEAFELSKHFIVRYVVIGLLVGLAVAVPFIVSVLLMFVIIGFILVPLAIVWAVAVWFFTLLAPYILMSKDLSISDTLKSSYDISKQNWQWVLALVVVYCGVQAASIVPFIGGLVSLVLMIAYACLPAYIYVEHIEPTLSTNQVKAKQATPDTNKVSKTSKSTKTTKSKSK